MYMDSVLLAPGNLTKFMALESPGIQLHRFAFESRLGSVGIMGLMVVTVTNDGVFGKGHCRIGLAS